MNIQHFRGAGAQDVTVKSTGCGFDPQSRKCYIDLNVYFHFFALDSRQSTAFAPPKFGGKWGTECLTIPSAYFDLIHCFAVACFGVELRDCASRIQSRSG